MSVNSVGGGGAAYTPEVDAPSARAESTALQGPNSPAVVDEVVAHGEPAFTGTATPETAAAQLNRPATRAEVQQALARTGVLLPMLDESISTYREAVEDQGPEHAERAAGIVLAGKARAGVVAASRGTPDSRGDIACAVFCSRFLDAIDA
ncbi:MAG: hypothetical protein AAF654_02595 [Myxococcota bacterium]